MTAYYNENDPFAAAWLRELINANLIAAGEVDERDIEEVQPTDLKGFVQCHFFAGIGVWSYALRLAGWPDDRPVWTGSCPCPSFSAAGKGEGFEDPRHLWPCWFGLIRESKPPTIFGEQADKAIGFGWLDLVQADLEAQGYAVGATVFGAHSVGAPHRRQRLYFVADAAETRCDNAREYGSGRSLLPARPEQCSTSLNDPDAQHTERWTLNEHRENGRNGQDNRRTETHSEPRTCGEVFNGSDANGGNASTERIQRSGEYGLRTENGCSIGLEGNDEWTETSNGWVGARHERDGESNRLAEDRKPTTQLSTLNLTDSKIDRTPIDTEAGKSHAKRIGATVNSENAHIGGRTAGSPQAGSCSPEIYARQSDKARDSHDTNSARPFTREQGSAATGYGSAVEPAGSVIDSLNSEQSRLEGHFGNVREWRGPGWLDPITARSAAQAGATRGYWGDCDWWYGRDEKYRPIGAGLFPLVTGAPARVGRLRGYGNSIVAPQAQAFIEAYLDHVSQK